MTNAEDPLFQTWRSCVLGALTDKIRTTCMRLRLCCGHIPGVSSRMRTTDSAPSITSRSFTCFLVLSPCILHNSAFRHIIVATQSFSPAVQWEAFALRQGWEAMLTIHKRLGHRPRTLHLVYTLLIDMSFLKHHERNKCQGSVVLIEVICIA